MKKRGKTAGKGEKTKGGKGKGKGWNRSADKGMAVRTAAQKKRKNCNYAELGASCFCPP
ncbi:hypothetical protein [Bacteroides gallinaceum]|uniref:hypothetical protein n=1 Tax=Bacteroides gallinaceum TaxID=1462571 RepID=UPI0025AAE2E4|nr:hypothetical protein [Bacteroides gallinaceum]MDN0067314.1 hypothetical protein [Bacteroides gallinaceum]